jgi:hypothetical protein
LPDHREADVAETPSRRVVSLEERREIMLRRSNLATLTTLDNWIVLCTVVEEEIDRIKKAMMGRMLVGQGMTLEQQAYERGRIVGLRAALSIPKKARAKELTESSPTDQEVSAGE